MNSVELCKRLADNKQFFLMQFHDVGVGLDTDIDSRDISEILFFGNQIEITNHDDLIFLTDDKHIYEIWDDANEENYIYF